jgi:hypothetical protein
MNPSAASEDKAPRKALFVREGDTYDTYRPTQWARGPWDPQSLHGGPTAVLLAHALESLRGDAALFLSRMTVDLFKPVPHAALRTSTKVAREGRRIKVVDAEIHAASGVVARASGVFLRRPGLDAGSATPPAAPPSWQGVASQRLGQPEDSDERFHRCIEARPLERAFSGRLMKTWMRSPFEFLPGTPLSAFQRVASLSDFINHAGQLSRPQRKSFINVDLTLYLHREAQGEWILLESIGRGDRDGIASSSMNLHDEGGLIGHVSAGCIANDMPGLDNPGRGE